MNDFCVGDSPGKLLLLNHPRFSHSFLIYIWKFLWIDPRKTFQRKKPLLAKLKLLHKVFQEFSKQFLHRYKRSKIKWNSAGIYMFKVNNRKTRLRCKICLKLIIKTPERRHWHHSGVFIVNFEIFHTHASVSIANFELVNAGWENSVLETGQQEQLLSLVSLRRILSTQNLPNPRVLHSLPIYCLYFPISIIRKRDSIFMSVRLHVNVTWIVLIGNNVHNIFQFPAGN